MLKTNCNNKFCANISFIFQRILSTKTVNDENIVDISSAKPFETIPGPKPVPIFGTLWHNLPYVGKYYGTELHEVHFQYQKEYGNIVLLRDLKVIPDTVLCYDPKDIETVFRNEGAWPRRDVLPSIIYYREKIRPDVFQGYTGVFASDGENWQEARTIMNSLLMQPRVVKHYIAGFSTVADDFIARIKYLASKNDLHEMPDDFQKEIVKWTLESIGVLALDARFGLLENKELDREKLQYIENIAIFFDVLYQIDILPSLTKYFSTPTWKKFVKLLDEIVGFIHKQINITKERIEKEGLLDKDENDMSIMEKMMKNYDQKYIYANVIDLIIAGVDTTSRSMAAIMYYLASNPDKQDILRKEVNEVLPDNDEVLTLQKLEKMPYLRAVIKESMRFSPIGLGWTRVTPKDIVLSGYHIPKGTHIVLEQLPLYWSEEHFPDAKKFIPERWLRKEKKKQEINPWVLLPFGFGPRACVGRRVANLELEVLLAKVMKNFKMEWHHSDPKYEMKLLFGIVSPLKIRMKPIKK